jgi:OmpA-OmpF porin, OOP family
MRKIAIVALLSAFAAAPAVAADMYANVKIGQASYGYSGISNNSQNTFGILGGYTINPSFAVEAEYNSLGGFDSLPNTIKGTSIGINAVGTLPLNPEFSMFGKLGITNSSLKETAPGVSLTHKNTGISIGLGATYNVNSTVGIQAGIDSIPVGDTASGKDRAQAFYVGGIFKF